jgi:hypothetical protein
LSGCDGFWLEFNQSTVEKAVPGFFYVAFRKAWFSKSSHFRRLALSKMAAAMYRAQLVKKQVFLQAAN